MHSIINALFPHTYSLLMVTIGPSVWSLCMLYKMGKGRLNCIRPSIHLLTQYMHCVDFSEQSKCNFLNKTRQTSERYKISLFPFHFFSLWPISFESPFSPSNFNPYWSDWFHSGKGEEAKKCMSRTSHYISTDILHFSSLTDFFSPDCA